MHKDLSWALDALKIIFYGRKNKTCQVMHWMWQPSVHLDVSKKCFLNYIWIFCMLRETICMSSTDTWKSQAVLEKLYKHKHLVCQILCLSIKGLVTYSWFCVYNIDWVKSMMGVVLSLKRGMKMVGRFQNAWTTMQGKKWREVYESILINVKSLLFWV